MNRFQAWRSRQMAILPGNTGALRNAPGNLSSTNEDLLLTCRGETIIMPLPENQGEQQWEQKNSPGRSASIDYGVSSFSGRLTYPACRAIGMLPGFHHVGEFGIF